MALKKKDSTSLGLVQRSFFFAWPPDRLTRFLFARRELMGAIYCHLSPVTDLGERYVTLWRLTLLLQAVERDKFG